MAKVIFGNHSSVLVPRQDRDSIGKFYCDVDSLKGKTWVLGNRLTLADFSIGGLLPTAERLRTGRRFSRPCTWSSTSDAAQGLPAGNSLWASSRGR